MLLSSAQTLQRPPIWVGCLCVWFNERNHFSCRLCVSAVSHLCVCVCVCARMHASGVAVCIYVQWPMHYSTLPLPSPPSCADPSATTHVVQTSEDSKQQTHKPLTLSVCAVSMKLLLWMSLSLYCVPCMPAVLLQLHCYRHKR